MPRHLPTILLAVTSALLGNTVHGATGPAQSPLKVMYMYTNGGSGAIYVSFQSGAMPGCYGNAGGYLFTSNTFYKEIYAQLLTMTANGGLNAAVIYTQNTPTNNWDDCTITGLYLYPQ